MIAPSMSPSPLHSLLTGAATAGLAVAAQVAAWRLAGHPVPLALLGSHLLVVLAVHLAAALLLARWRDGRPWALALLLLPPLLAVLPAVDRWGGWSGVALATAGASALWAAGSFAGRAPGRPLAAAAVGAALGVAVASALRGIQLEAEPYTPEPLAKTVLALLAAAALALLLGAGRRLPDLPSPRLSLGIAVASLALALAASLTGLPPGVPEPPRAGSSAPPVVLIVLDTVRADHLRSYGYTRDTMPRLERFAREHAVRIEGALANAPSSLETHASLFTGLYPFRHGAHKPREGEPRPPLYAHPLASGVPTLATLMRRAGYWPVGVSANFGPLAPAFGLGRGFAVYHARPGLLRGPSTLDPFRFALWRRWPLAAADRLPPFAASEFFELGVPYRRAADIADAGIAALDAGGETPLFLFLNFMEAHYPYRPPRSFTDIFPGIRRPGLARLDDEQAAAAEVMAEAMAEVTAGGRPLTAAEREAWTAAYDSALRYLDGELGRLLDRLERHPRFPEMLVVITADHGEALGEHGLLRHSTSLYEEMLRIPLFVKPGTRRPPDFQPGRIVPRPFQPVDLFPTVLVHAGVPIPPGLDGRAWGAGRRALFAECYPHPPARALGERFRHELRAVVADGWKLILSTTGRAELYDLVRDPGETSDLSTREPERLARLRALLESTLTGEGRRRRAPGPDGEALERSLRSLGYVQ
jgi:arylsulfatase A-like enzyme